MTYVTAAYKWFMSLLSAHPKTACLICVGAGFALKAFVL
jgi:hypothetical protein